MCFEVFQMSIPCTGRDTGIAGLELGLQIFNKNGRPIRGSPMKLKLKKQCNAIGQWNSLQLKWKGAFCMTSIFKKIRKNRLNERCSHTMAKLDICFDFFYEWIKLLSVELAIYLIYQLWSMIWLRRLLTGTKTTCKIQMLRKYITGIFT